MSRISIISTLIVIALGGLILLLLLNGNLGKVPTGTQGQTLNGDTIAFDQHNKPYLLTFWSTDCPACIAEMPHLEKLKQTLGDKMDVIAVAMDFDPETQVRAFMAKNPYPFEVVLDTDGHIAQAFGGVRLTPTNVLVDGRGNIIYQKIGEPDFAKWQQTLLELSTS